MFNLFIFYFLSANLASILSLFFFLHFSFHCSLNKVTSISGFLICITVKLRNLAFWCKWLSLVSEIIFCHYLFAFILRWMNAPALIINSCHLFQRTLFNKGFVVEGEREVLKEQMKTNRGRGGERLSLSLCSLCEKNAWFFKQQIVFLLISCLVVAESFIKTA